MLLNAKVRRRRDAALAAIERLSAWKQGGQLRVDEWQAIEEATGWQIPAWVREGCATPRLVNVPEGRELYAAGPDGKSRMDWGAFEENDLGWYFRGNQLDPSWYSKSPQNRVPIYEYRIVVGAGVRAVMSKVASQRGAPARPEPAKFQFYCPVGLGAPARGRLLGHIEPDGAFTPLTSAA